jgi:hypothetical protein
MASLPLSLSNYQTGLVSGLYSPPESLCPYFDVDPKLYREQGRSGERRDSLAEALRQLRLRTGRDYFRKTYPVQTRTLDYSARSFPAYRYILPEVMSEDWLAIVDWGKFQRDHVLHQPLAGYVTLALLNGDNNVPLTLPCGSSILDFCVTNILKWERTRYIRDFLIGCGMSENDPILDQKSPVARQVWRIFFREAAYVAAIFHDLGYPWQYAERLHKNLKGMNSPATMKNRSAAQVVSQFGHRLLFHALRGYQLSDAASPSRWVEQVELLTDSALSGTHGFPGALGFLHLNDAVRKFPSSAQSPLRLLCVEWAAVAIMMHDMAKIYWGKDRSTGVPENPSLRLSFAQDPLSALITLADILQEFERPSAVFGQTSGRGGANRVAISYGIACLSSELRIDGTKLTICYQMKDSDARAIKRKSMQADAVDYFDPRHGFLDMQSLGITDVNLQVT